LKLTLTFDIFNKGHWLEGMIDSWLSRLSGSFEYEIIVVLDACKDDSEQVALRSLEKWGLPYKILYADDKYEIYCNQLALNHATGDWIVFIQDDNWMYDLNWDSMLRRVIRRIPQVGVIGLLAGADIVADFRWNRIEVNRPHKGANFQVEAEYILGVWLVDTVCRPFAANVAQLKGMGGLDFQYRPTMFDDIDLSLKLSYAQAINVLIPFDVVNTVAGEATIGLPRIREIFDRNIAICRAAHQPEIHRLIQAHQCRVLDYLQETNHGLGFI